MSDMKELRDALITALEWIDAVPRDTPLPAMPGFDRDSVDELLDRTADIDKSQPIEDSVMHSCITYVIHGDADFSDCNPDLVQYFKSRVDEVRKVDNATWTQPVPSVEPVAWVYELATYIGNGQYTGWKKLLGFYRPDVPPESIRCAQPLYTAPQAPSVSDDVRKDAERYRWLAAYCRSTSEHWGGRWSIVIDGPAPKSHDSEDDLDEAIDAAIAAKQGDV